MCMFSSALRVWLQNIGLPIWVCLSPAHSLYVCLHTCRPSPPLPYRGLRLARTGGPIKLTLWVLGLLARNRGKDLFHCCVNHCFISTLFSPSFCSDISQGFWLPFKCEHNTAIEIMAHTSWPEQGSALVLALAATTSCSNCHNYFLFFPIPNFLFKSGCGTDRQTHYTPMPHPPSCQLRPSP